MNNQKSALNIGKILILIVPLLSLLSFISIYLYFTGWVYTYFYLSHFGISIYDMDIPLYSFFIYAFSVIISLPFIVFFITLTIISSIFLYFKRTKEYIRNNSIIILTCLFILMFPILYLYSYSSAKEEIDMIEKENSIFMVFTHEFDKSDTIHIIPEFIGANKNNRLKLIVETKNKFYVILPSSSGIQYVYGIPKSNISITRVNIENKIKDPNR